uniref:EF-hand domain-containing protein n=1 Tax=Glycine max TaxID=3847 RepID=I1LIP6_SOYBN
MERGSGKLSRKKSGGGNGQVLDGSNIMELVGNQQVFTTFVDHKFHELDTDKDGKLSVKELQPAVADIGAALGLPAHGTNPDSDHIYSEVLNEFTHGKQENVSKSEFKEVLSDILLGMAAGLKRDPIVILRIDGEDLLEFVNGSGYEAEMNSIFSQIESPNRSLHDHIIEALGKLTVEQGIPPTSDSWVAKLYIHTHIYIYIYIVDFLYTCTHVIKKRHEKLKQIFICCEEALFYTLITKKHI